MYLLFAICFFSFQFGYSQQAFLHGHILDKHTASPISNAQIVLFKDDHYLSKSKSDHAGKFYFSELLKGTYAVWVVKKGFCKHQLLHIEVNEKEGVRYDLELIKTTLKNGGDEIIAFYQGPYISNDQRFILNKRAEFQTNIFELYGQTIEIKRKKFTDIELDRRATHYYSELDRTQQKLGKNPY